MKDTRIESHRDSTFKTKHYTQQQVDHLNNNATFQARTIARLYYYGYPNGFTPSQAEIGVRQIGAAKGEKPKYTWPLTSTRRAITNLTKAGILVKTGETLPGNYDKPEHVWKWKAPEPKPTQADMFGAPESKSNAYTEPTI